MKDELQELEARRRAADRWWTYRRDSIVMSKDYGSATVRALVTINGGALIALISFMAAKAQQKGANVALSYIDMKWAFGCFVLGLLLAVLAGALGYFNFQYHANYLPGPDGLKNYEQNHDVSGWRIAAANKIYWSAAIAAIFCFSSVGLFSYGAYNAFEGVLRMAMA